MKGFIALCLLVGLAACGKDGGGGGSKDDGSSEPTAVPHSALVNTLAELPACDAAAQGWLVYVAESQTFKSCNLGAWADVAIKGAKGDAGVAGSEGEAGKNGADGKDGSDNHIVASIFCGGPLENTDLYFSYSVAVMGSGDVFATGATKRAEQQIGSTSFYSVHQAGSLDASVIFTDDYETPAVGSWWEISLNRTSLVTSIVYHGATDTNWTMEPEDCTANEYD